MHPSIQPLFDQLEARRESILNSFHSFSNERFNQRPSKNKWSAAEILSHLLTAERLSVAYMQKKAQGISGLSRTGLWEEVKLAILILSQRIPGLKFKAPKRVVEGTTVLRSLPEITAAWTTVRKDLRALLENLPAEYLDRKLYRHPVAGYLNPVQAVIFFREHLIHHSPQLQRLLN